MGYQYTSMRKSDDGKTITFLSGVKIAFEDGGNKLITCGYIGTAETITPTTAVPTIVPIQIYLKANADGGSGTIGAAYFKTENITVDQPAQQLATCMVRTTLNFNIFDAYGLQSHLSIADDMETADANAHLTAISGKVTFTSGKTVAKGWVTAGLFIIEGDGTVTQMCHGVSIVEEAGSTGAQSLLHLNTDVGTTPYLSLAGADGTGKSIYTHTAPPTITGTIKILVNGAARWIPFASAE